MRKLTATDYKKQAGRKRRKSDKKHLNHLKDLWDTLRNAYPTPAWPCGKDREYNDDNPEYYKREYRGRRSKQIKKQCNEKLRNSDGEQLFRHGEYKKHSDFWWDYC